MSELFRQSSNSDILDTINRCLYFYSMSLINLPLDVAATLVGDRELEIVETAPPREPRHYTPVWGAWRVVRERELADGKLQLTVARELLQELRDETPGKNR